MLVEEIKELNREVGLWLGISTLFDSYKLLILIFFIAG